MSCCMFTTISAFEILFVSKFKSSNNLFIIVDLPTPDCPLNTMIPPIKGLIAFDTSSSSPINNVSYQLNDIVLIYLEFVEFHHQ